jgi:peptide/nickel transport system permease protein
MLRVIRNRLLLTIPTMFVVATFTFFLIQLVPGDPANFMLGQGATLEQVQLIHHELGLDKPLLTQYVDWLSGVLRGDLGRSFITDQTVTSQLSAAVPATLSLALLATLTALVLGLAGGVFAGLRGGRIDRLLQSAASLGLGVPNFWLAVLLVYLFAILWPILPATGYTPLTVSPRQWIMALVLPVTAIAVNNTAQIMFQARSSVLEVISRDFVRTLQATGLSRRRIVLKHVLRNAAIPVVTVAGFVFVVTLGGVVVIEVIFNILGVGRVFLNAVNQHDLPVVQGAILYFTLAVMIVNLLVDLLVAWLDPRIRLA